MSLRFTSGFRCDFTSTRVRTMFLSKRRGFPSIHPDQKTSYGDRCYEPAISVIRQTIFDGTIEARLVSVFFIRVCIVVTCRILGAVEMRGLRQDICEVE